MIANSSTDAELVSEKILKSVLYMMLIFKNSK